MKISCFFFLTSLLLGSDVLWSQQYDIITEMFKNSDTVLLQKEYCNWRNLELNKEKIIASWNFQSVLGGPDSVKFDEAFDVVKFENLDQDKYINFEKLPSNFYPKRDSENLMEENKNFRFNILSTPIFNSKKDWAIIYHHLIWPLGSGNENLYIFYKDCKGSWIKYYTITLSFY